MMNDKIEIDPNDTTEVRYRIEALKRDPALEAALRGLAKDGVESLESVKVSGVNTRGGITTHKVNSWPPKDG